MHKLTPCRLQVQAWKLLTDVRLLHFPVSDSSFCLPLVLFRSTSALLGAGTSHVGGQFSFSGMAAFLLPLCMWFCSGSFCFQTRHFLSRAAVVEVFCSSWWHLALVAVRRSRDVLMWGYSLLPATATQTASTPRTRIKPRIRC